MTDTTAVAVEVIDDLLGAWSSRQEFTFKPPRPKTLSQLGMVSGLSAHVFLTAAMLRPSIPDAMRPPHFLWIRSIWETTFTIIWVDQNPDAAQAVLNELSRNRGNIRDTMRKGSPGMAARAHQVAHADDPRIPTSLDAEARSFQALLGDSLSAHDIYATYRMLSGSCHPGAQLVDNYITDEAESVGFALHRDGKQVDPAHVDVVACCLVWTFRVCTYYSPRDAPLRRLLRTSAAKLGIRAEV